MSLRGRTRALRTAYGHRLPARLMRPVPIVCLCLSVTALRSAAAQDTAIVIYPDSTAPLLEQRELPRLVAEEVVQLYNAATTTRLYGRTRLPTGNAWQGDVAIRVGPALVAGRVVGTLLVVNGDLSLAESAEITGDVIVIGGTIYSAPGATVAGAVREYREPLPYRLRDGELVYTPALRRRFPRIGTGRTWARERSRSTLMLATGGTFNRVEGLPVVFGPAFDFRLGDGLRFKLDALGVFRTAGDLSDSRSDLGYRLRAELRTGERRATGIALHAFDVVSPVGDASWLRDHEVGWAAFLLHRDYRDYYLNKGVAGRVTLEVARPLLLALELRREWHTSVEARDPWTVLRTHQDWRANPPVDEGHFLAVGAAVTLDTRNDHDTPSSGWYVRAHIEHSSSGDVSPQTGLPSVRPAIPLDGSYAFSRASLDVRSYARVSASGRMHLRLLAGGWLGGDPLPLQYRLNLGGPDPMPGYLFRHSACNRDVIDPVFAPTRLAACDRLLLLQAEYRGHIKLNWSYPAGDGNAPRDRDVSGTVIRLEGPDLVVFADGGQAWLVGDGPGRVPANRIPTLGSWLAELGLGIDWAGLGIYVAKAVTVGQPIRFTVRLDHRF